MNLVKPPLQCSLLVRSEYTASLDVANLTNISLTAAHSNTYVLYTMKKVVDRTGPDTGY